jgi:signal transduction histidine kinase
MRTPADLSIAYRAEAEQLAGERLTPAVALFLLCGSGFGILEYGLDASSASSFLVLFAFQAFVAMSAIVLRPAFRRRQVMVRASVVLGLVLSVLPHLQTMAVELPTELMGIVTVCTVTGMSLVMPWGPRGQTVIAASNLLAYGLALYVNGAVSTHPVFLFFAVSTGGALSVIGARYLDLHRFAIFREATLSEEEAAVNRALVAVAKEINTVLGRPDALDRICDSTRRALHCDWSIILLRDEERGVFRAAGGVGRDTEALREIGVIEFTPESFPLLSRILSEEHVGVARRSAVDPITAAFMQRWHTHYILAAALTRSGQAVGVLVAGGDNVLDGISLRVRQLFRGIAPHAAIALNNVRLVNDLRQADQLKSEFLSTMSHELRTPLNVILGYSELLAEDTFGPLLDEQRDTVGRVHDSARSLLELINMTLDVNRMEAGRLSVQLAAVDLWELFDEVRDELEHPHTPEVLLRWDLALGHAPVRTDAGKLKIILKNLVSNALKFTGSGQVQVQVSYDARAARLRLCVADTGSGIHPDDLGHIFEMFRQAGNGHERGGVGLGLYIVKRFVEQLAGEVSVTSTPGKGSTFTVSLPAAVAAHDAAVEQHAA